MINFNEEGLSNVRAIASAQFSKNELENVVEYVNKVHKGKRLIVADLREEKHAFIGVDGDMKSITWYAPYNAINLGKSVSEVIKDENHTVDSLKTKKFVRISDFNKTLNTFSNSKNVLFKKAFTERELVDDILGDDYYRRFTVTDHTFPLKNEFERMKSFIESLDDNTIVYVHCRGGMGRTTTFLALYDIIKNGGKVSFEDIIERQYKIGGSNLSRDKKSAVKKFLKEFYDKIHVKSL